ncbi:MAG: ZIP family metal transporter [Bacilli bacterium]
MNILIAISLSFISGLFMLVGMFIVFKSKSTSKVLAFSVSLGVVVLVGLCLFHIIPDAINFLKYKYEIFQCAAFIILFSIVGFIGFQIVDRYSGHHDNTDLKHVAIITCIVLLLHNFIEGMALYTTVEVSLKSGVLFCIGIALHNIPLGLTVSSEFYSSTKDKKKTFLFNASLIVATVAGSFLISLFNINPNNSLLFGILLSLTLGMIGYIVINELLPMLKNKKFNNLKLAGLIVGIVLMVLTVII